MDDPLERHYRRLLLAYPAEYRQRRGDELIATLLDVAQPGQRRPRLAEALDVLGGGLRQRLRLHQVTGLEAGLVRAGPVALALAAGIALFAWWRVEPIAARPSDLELFGQFRTLGPIAYAAWLIAAMLWAIAPTMPGRVSIAAAVSLTAALPAAALMTTVDRPPLWVVSVLVALGVIAYLGTGHAAGAAPPDLQTRWAVALGAPALALAASTVRRIWPPVVGADYYYQPTMARVGLVVAAVVAVLAGVATLRALRHQPAAGWLWATIVLALPAGWLGPFDTGQLRVAADGGMPHFGRLAQVLLATCVFAAAVTWLLARSPATPSALRTRASGTARAGALASTGAASLGFLAGLAAFVLLGWAGLVGFTGPAPSYAAPGPVVAAGAALLVAGGLALACQPGRWRWRVVGGSAVAGMVVGWGIAVYDNGWTGSGWTDFSHTMLLVATVALAPLSGCALMAARAWRTHPVRTTAVLTVSLGWLGFVTLPYVLSWGPVVLMLLGCGFLLTLAGRRSPRSLASLSR